MATIVSSVGLKGMEGYLVQVEVQLLPGIEGVHIVGLPDASVKESKDRVMGALYANDCRVPDKKIIINLSPSEQRKNSPIFDLAMAIGVMKEANECRAPIPRNAAFLGVLSLDGSIKPVNGMLPAILAARKSGVKVLYMPPMDDFPIQHLEDMEIRVVETLQEVIDSFSGKVTAFSATQRPAADQAAPVVRRHDKDFKHVIGHRLAKRAMEIAAAGGHHILMTGPPGCGKSLLAETFPSILPDLTQEAQFDVISILQLAGVQYDHAGTPPFRDPHHSASAVSLIGGGANPKPGEVSLAHHGVLFLDEMAEFPKRTLDMLRQPLENGSVTISRAAQAVTYPARFQLIGAMNPCPCGHLGSRHFYCTCSPKQIRAYTNRLSGPILDRMDIVLELDREALDDTTVAQNETSADIRSRVERARAIQYKRYGAGICNATAANEQLLACSKLTAEQERMMQKWSSKYHWSTRTQMKIRRLARTISDLSSEAAISNEAIWEAVTIRRTQDTMTKKGMVQ